MKAKSIISVLAVISLMLFLMPQALAGDTGTYGIREYKVTLIPHSNGQIDIAYEQEWIVKSGHIPWVTVGTPNSDYSIKSFGGAAKSVKPQNGGGWYGVRVDLDRDYQPQEKFRFNFTIVQNKLLEKADAGGYRLQFTPGWYDRAVTDDLTIKLVSPAKTEELKTDPKPSSISGQELSWNRKNLGNGEKFPVSVSFPNGTYNQSLMEESGQSGGDDGFLFVILFVFGAIFVIFLLSAILSSDTSTYGGSSGGYSSSESIRRRRRDDDDEYKSPVILSGSSRGSSSHSTSSKSGSGGGFGGRSSSCACACVSCACACACAGGGGAGCTKKFRHNCEKCSPRKADENENENEKGAI